MRHLAEANERQDNYCRIRMANPTPKQDDEPVLLYAQSCGVPADVLDKVSEDAAELGYVPGASWITAFILGADAMRMAMEEAHGD